MATVVQGQEARSPQVLRQKVSPIFSPIQIADRTWSKGELVSHVTIPNGIECLAGCTLEKVWQLKNIGTRPWRKGSTLTLLEGPLKPVGASKVPTSAPGATALVMVTILVPSTLRGYHSSKYQLRDPDGRSFGPVLTVGVTIRTFEHFVEEQDRESFCDYCCRSKRHCDCDGAVPNAEVLKQADLHSDGHARARTHTRPEGSAPTALPPVVEAVPTSARLVRPVIAQPAQQITRTKDEEEAAEAEVEYDESEGDDYEGDEEPGEAVEEEQGEEEEYWDDGEEFEDEERDGGHAEAEMSASPGAQPEPKHRQVQPHQQAPPPQQPRKIFVGKRLSKIPESAMAKARVDDTESELEQERPAAKAPAHKQQLQQEAKQPEAKLRSGAKKDRKSEQKHAKPQKEVQAEDSGDKDKDKEKNPALKARVHEDDEVFGDDPDEDKELKLDPSEISFEVKLGEGTFGEVFQGRLWGQTVAVKKLKLKKITKKKLEDFYHEVRVMKPLRHPNIVQFLGASYRSPFYCMVTEFISNGSLEKLLFTYKKQGKSLSTKRILSWAGQIARGVNWLHHKGVIHRDLKSANILVGSDYNTLKIADFGLAHIKSSAQLHKGGFYGACGTPCYMAPEVITEKHYGVKADVFSFAIVLVEMITGVYPYDNMSIAKLSWDTFDQLIVQGARPEIPSTVEPALRALIEQCWQENPDLRPCMDDVVFRLAEMEKDFQLSREDILDALSPQARHVVAEEQAKVKDLETQLSMAVEKNDRLADRLSKEMAEREEVDAALQDRKRRHEALQFKYREKKAELRCLHALLAQYREDDATASANSFSSLSLVESSPLKPPAADAAQGAPHNRPAAALNGNVSAGSVKVNVTAVTVKAVEPKAAVASHLVPSRPLPNTPGLAAGKVRSLPVIDVAAAAGTMSPVKKPAQRQSMGPAPLAVAAKLPFAKALVAKPARGSSQAPARALADLTNNPLRHT